MALGIKWWHEVSEVKRPETNKLPRLIRLGADALRATAVRGNAIRVPKSRLQNFNVFYKMALKEGYRMHRESNGDAAYLWWSRKTATRRTKRGVGR